MQQRKSPARSSLDRSLEGQRVVIIGGTTGFGTATAKAASAEGGFPHVKDTMELIQTAKDDHATGEVSHRPAVGLRRNLRPVVPDATSQNLGWAGLQANRYRNLASNEIHMPAISQHLLILHTKPPAEENFRFEGVKREIRPPAGSITVIPIRYIFGRRRLVTRADGVLTRRNLTTIVDYIMADLHHSPTLEQMAALVSLSPYHFARQFKAATGLPPHQFLITRRVERAQQILRGRGNLSLAEVAKVLGSLTKASSVFTSNGSLASPQGDFGPPQKAPKS